MALTHGDLMFARNLDEKLQKIQDKDAANLYIHNDLNSYKDKNHKMMNNRPQFITTVKKGVFLEPPPEVAALLGLSPNKSSASAISPLSGGSSSTSSTQKETNTTVIMYSYSSKPKVLHKNYHNDCSKSLLNNVRDGTTPYGNLMFDRRIIRGSTYATQSTPTEETQARQREARRRVQARKKARVYSSRGRQGTPPPVAGRKHEPVQTERFLEELLDRPPETDASCQTDLFLDRPPSPMFLSSSGGEDKETQIYLGDVQKPVLIWFFHYLVVFQLFDFDALVAPIVESMMAEVLQNGLSEVMEEEELMNVQIEQRRLLEIRAFEELQNEGKEIRKSSLAEMNIDALLPGVLEKLEKEGFEVGSEDLGQIKDLISARLASSDILENILRDALRQPEKS